MKVYLIEVMFLFINLLDSVRPDALSLSIVGMESLVAKETLLIDNLQLYLDELDKKAEVIRSNLNLMRAENQKAISEGDAYLMNPLQAFALLRRTYSDWTYWEYYMQKSIGDEYVNNIVNERSTNPTDEDFQEAADGIYRLQDTYGLNPIDMAVGKLNGVQYNASLSAIDCFSIAYYFYGQKRNEAAEQWFHSALNQFKDDDTINEVLRLNLSKILYFRAQNLEKLYNLTGSIHLLERLLDIDPGNQLAIKQKDILESQVEANESLPTTEPENEAFFVVSDEYRQGCRGEFKQRDPKLRCVYNATTDPFLKLAPLKMEEINLDPYMVLYHDVISDVEIGILKDMAKPMLERAPVLDPDTFLEVADRTRTSKFAWFPDNANQVMERVNQRLADLTGFNLNRSEQIQVMNYGLAGHYDVHIDFFEFPMDHELIKDDGNRIATAMFYLSDVEQGGATVFPNIELAVFPKKGACIVWYNLNTRGEGDLKALHGACPVIVGSKWVSVKWIREKDQIFKRPCLPEETT